MQSSTSVFLVNVFCIVIWDELGWQQTVCVRPHRLCRPVIRHTPDRRETRTVSQSQTPTSRLWKSLGSLFIFPFIILLLLGGHHSLLSCSGELPVVNSSAGSNCCTCNCQSTLQAILQELRTMRKLMQIQAGMQIRPQREDLQWGCSLCFDYTVPPALLSHQQGFLFFFFNLFNKFFMEV